MHRKVNASQHLVNTPMYAMHSGMEGIVSLIESFNVQLHSVIPETEKIGLPKLHKHCSKQQLEKAIQLKENETKIQK